MTIRSKNLTRFASLMVALGLMLGLAVTGCSNNDRNGGQDAKMTGITYQFAQILDVSPKANLAAVFARMTAFRADGKAVAVEQTSDKISDHKDVTPVGAVGMTVWEGTAKVAADTNTIVITYLDENENEVGVPDVVTNVDVTKDTNVDFTIDPETGDAKWEPAASEQLLTVDEVVTIGAKDAEGNDLTVELRTAAEEVAVDGVNVTGVAATADGETADVTAIATDAEGKTVSTKTYNFTVIAVNPDVIWTPNESSPSLEINSTMAIAAEDKEGNAYTVELSTTATEVAIDKNEVTGIAATADDAYAEVIATAKDGDKVVDTKTFNFTVKYLDLIWSPEGDSAEVDIGKIIFFSAKDEATEYIVSLESKSSAIAIDEESASVKGLASTTEDAPAEVTATATNTDGQTVCVKTFFVKVNLPALTWDPSDAELHLSKGDQRTVTATDEDGNHMTVTLISNSTQIRTSKNTFTCAGATGGDLVSVTAYAENENGTVVGEMTYNCTIDNPTVIWDPAPSSDPFQMIGGDSYEFIAKDDAGTPYTEYDLIAASSSLVTIKGNVATAIRNDKGTYSTEITARVKKNGIMISEVKYKVNIIPLVSWPQHYPIYVKEKKPVTITAVHAKGLPITTLLTSKDTRITIEGNTLIYKDRIPYNDKAIIIGHAFDADNKEISTFTYNCATESL